MDGLYKFLGQLLTALAAFLAGKRAESETARANAAERAVSEAKQGAEIRDRNAGLSPGAVSDGLRSVYKARRAKRGVH